MQYRCVSLFAGCGGLDLGFQRAGFNIALATDNDPTCAESHRRNFASGQFLCAPIEAIGEQELAAAMSRRVDLLVGGPPCPAYSKSRFYRPEKPRALRDPAAHATLDGYLRILDILRPRAFLL